MDLPNILARISTRIATVANRTSETPEKGEILSVFNADNTQVQLYVGNGTTPGGLAPAASVTIPAATASELGGVKIAGVLSGTANAPTLANSGVTAGTYAGLLSVEVEADGRVKSIIKLDDPKTLVIPGATDGASGAQLLTYARTLKEVKVLCRTTAFADAVPSAATTVLIKKVVSGVTTTIATISGITTATTTYDVNPDVTVESGAYVYAQISGSNNGVAVVNAVLVWG